MHKGKKPISSLIYSLSWKSPPDARYAPMAPKAVDPTGSYSLVGKEYLMTEKTICNLLCLLCTPQASLPDKVTAVAHRVFLKLPVLIMFCESDMGYIHQLTPFYVPNICCHPLEGYILAMLETSNQRQEV